MTVSPILIAALLLAAPSREACDMVRAVSHTQAFADVEQTLAATEQSMLADAADGQLDDTSLLQAVLIASGHTDANALNELSDRLEAWRRGVLKANLPDDETARAREIFTRLHAELLTGNYDAHCSDVAEVLKSGDYNCVSATVLYVDALRAAGISADAYATPGHVFCRIGAGHSEVETTCDRWFELSREDAVKTQARAARVRRNARRDSRKLTDVQLVAKIYYNRGVAQFRRGEFEQGLLLTRRSLQLDPLDDVARGNVLAGLNNWSLSLCQKRKFAAAADLLDEMKQLDADYPTLAENEEHLYRLWGEQRLQQCKRQYDKCQMTKENVESTPRS